MQKTKETFAYAKISQDSSNTRKSVGKTYIEKNVNPKITDQKRGLFSLKILNFCSIIKVLVKKIPQNA